ncbi:hypothetical protein HN51_038846 [Arachis hypogaea]
MTSLHAKILFFGVNESVSMDAKTYLRCEVNSIYFANHRWKMQNETTERNGLRSLLVTAMRILRRPSRPGWQGGGP